MKAPSRAEPVYRSISPSELSEMAEMVGRVLEGELGAPTGGFERAEIARVEKGFDGSRDLILLAESEGRHAGVLLATQDAPGNGDAATIRLWAVEPQSRGHGIGRELLHRAVETLRERSVRTLRAVSLAVSPAAPRLFWMHGFRVTGLGSLEIGGRVRELIAFEKRLGGAHGEERC